MNPVDNLFFYFVHKLSQTVAKCISLKLGCPWTGDFNLPQFDHAWRKMLKILLGKTRLCMGFFQKIPIAEFTGQVDMAYPTPQATGHYWAY